MSVQADPNRHFLPNFVHVEGAVWSRCSVGCIIENSVITVVLTLLSNANRFIRKSGQDKLDYNYGFIAM